MIKHHFKELTKSYMSQIDPEKSEELKRTKADIESNLTRILKLIKKEEQSKRNENSRKETELVGLIEDFYSQYQSLNALYGRLTGEYVKSSPRYAERLSSVSSSSSSEYEYFSSEEISDTTKQEAELVNQQKRNLELQVESQANEVKQLSEKNTELELLLKETMEKLKSNEDYTKSITADLLTQINKLEQEAKSLRNHKGKMEEKIKRSRNEALSQKRDLKDQLNVMQQKFDSVCTHNNELETQLERERNQVSKCLVELEKWKDNLAETTSVKHSLIKEKECFISKINDLELEMESLRTDQHDLEEKLRNSSLEINRLEDEKKALQDEKYELEKSVTEKKEEIVAILKEHECDKNEASSQVMTLLEEVENMRVELGTLLEQKSKLEIQNEERQKEFSEGLAKMENLNDKLETKEETIKKLTETIYHMSGENKEAKIWSKMNQKLTERKMEELAEKFKMKMEDNIRLLHQRIHIAEQLNIENKDGFKKTKQRYEEENKILEQKIASCENELRALKMSDLNQLDTAAKKLEEHIDYVFNLVSKMLVEVQFAKGWIKEKNGETKMLKDNVDLLTVLLADKQEQEMLLRDKVWELEAHARKEGGEKLNLMKAVSQLEKNLKEKEEELIGLGEKKKEAIRQLCLLVEFHRERCDFLKGLITEFRISKGT